MRTLTAIKRRQVGGVLVALYKQEDGTYYLEAESNEFRVWRLTRDWLVAKEYYMRFCFWSWLIEAIPGDLFLRLATFMMRR